MTIRALQVSRGGAKRRGFSLIEAVLTLSVVAATLTLVVPAATSVLDNARKARVQMELNAIATAVVEYTRDTGRLPGSELLRHGLAVVLKTDDEMPDVGASAATQAWLLAPSLDSREYLNRPYRAASPRWRGPYLPGKVGKDPWGHAYLINIGQANILTPDGRRKRAVFTLSAGPNGKVDTPLSQPVTHGVVHGDDIAIRIQ